MTTVMLLAITHNDRKDNEEQPRHNAMEKNIDNMKTHWVKTTGKPVIQPRRNFIDQLINNSAQDFYQFYQLLILYDYLV